MFNELLCEKQKPILVLCKTNNECFYSCNGKNIFIRVMVRIFLFGERWNVLFNSAIASLNRTFHLSPHENILTIALINIHYLYNIIPKQAIAFQEQFMKQLSHIIIFNTYEKRRILFVFLCSRHFESILMSSACIKSNLSHVN